MTSYDAKAYFINLVHLLYIFFFTMIILKAKVDIFEGNINLFLKFVIDCDVYGQGTTYPLPDVLLGPNQHYRSFAHSI